MQKKGSVHALFSDKSWQLMSCTSGKLVSKQISWENSWGWDLGCCCRPGRLTGTADANSPGRVQIFQGTNYSCLLDKTPTHSSLAQPPPKHGARDSQSQILKAPEKHFTCLKGIWPAQRGSERQDQNLNRILPLKGSLTGSSSLSSSQFWLKSYPSSTRAPLLQCLLHGVCLWSQSALSIQLSRNKYPHCLRLPSLSRNPSRDQLLNSSEERTHFPRLPAMPDYMKTKKQRKEKLSPFLLTCRSASKAKHLTDDPPVKS